MLIRQQRFDLRMVQKLGHELGEYLAALQPVAVLREHGRVPHQVVGRKSHEPTVQKIVVKLLGHMSEFGATDALLRARRERPCSRRAAEQRDEVAPLHSITSSARASS